MEDENGSMNFRSERESRGDKEDEGEDAMD